MLPSQRGGQGARPWPTSTMKTLAWAGFIAGLVLNSTVGAAAPDPVIIEQENLIRREAEEKIQRDILDRILGEGRASVLVNVEVSLESEKRESGTAEGKVDDRKGLGDQDYILPWVPAQKSVSKNNEVPKDAKVESASGEIATSAIRQVVRRFDVTVIHDESMGKPQMELVDAAIRSAYSRYEKVMSVIYKATRFAKYEMKVKIREGFWDFLKPQYLLPGLIALLLLFFLFGPVWQFLRAVLKAMTARRGADMFSDSNTRLESKGENEDKDKDKDGKNGEGEEADALAALQKKMQEEKYIPFLYVDDKNLKRLIYLIRKEPPEVIAVIVSYLKPEFVKEILNSLVPELQAKVAMHMAAVKQMTQAEIRSLDMEIKEKIDFLVGGLHSLLKVLDEVNSTSRDNILEYLKNERPRLYEKVRHYILMFDDIINFPDQAMQIIVRELRTENLAKALQGASPDITNKVFNNMSKGAMALLKEEMEFSRALTPDQITDERQKILNTVKSLELAGKISIREKLPDDFLEWEDMEVLSNTGQWLAGRSSSEPAASPAANPEYFTAGIQLYQAGQYSEALPYLQYADQLDPRSEETKQYLGHCYYALGQYGAALATYETLSAMKPGDAALKQWVEQFRASISLPTT